jgi:hypothetical protein
VISKAIRHNGYVAHEARPPRAGAGKINSLSPYPNYEGERIEWGLIF